MRYLFVGIVGPALAVLGYDRSNMIRWVGSTDLTVEFVVTDAETGAPITGAELCAVDEARSATNPDAAEPHYKTDQNGVATAYFPSQMCAGAESRLRFVDTYSVRFPSSRMWVRAPGYSQSDSFALCDPPYRRAVQHAGPQQDRLIVSVALCKSQP